MYKTANQVKNAVSKQLGKYWNPKKRYAGFADTKYFLLKHPQIKHYLKHNKIKSAPQLGQGMDCDDFAFILKGNLSIANRDKFGYKASLGVGIAWGHFTWVPEFHAVNWFIDGPTGKLFWIEPQDGSIHPLNHCKPKSLSLLLL